MQTAKTDQTGRMPRLIWVFAGRTLTLLVLSCCGSIILKSRQYCFTIQQCDNGMANSVDWTDCLSKWAATWQNQQNECAPREDSDQPGHPPSLIRVFAVRIKKAWVLSYPLNTQRRLWSDWVDAQSLYWFCHVVAQMYLLMITMVNLVGLTIP